MGHPILVVSLLSETIPLAAAIYSRRFLTREMKILFVYLLIDQLSDLVMAFLGSRHVNNLWLTYVFILFQYVFFMWLFASWQKSILFKRILIASIPAFVILGILAMVFFEDLSQFNTLTRPISSLILIFVSAYTLFGLETTNLESVFTQTRFWIASAALLYFASSLAVVSLSNVIVGWPAERARQLFEVHAALNLIANIGYAGGFLCLVPRQKPGVR